MFYIKYLPTPWAKAFAYRTFLQEFLYFFFADLQVTGIHNNGWALVKLFLSLKSDSYGRLTMCCFLFQKAFGTSAQISCRICWLTNSIFSSILEDSGYSFILLKATSSFRQSTKFCFVSIISDKRLIWCGMVTVMKGKWIWNPRISEVISLFVVQLVANQI